jgi:hypothetical protein
VIGQLPTTIELDGEEWAIRSDFRIALLIFQGINDPELKDYSKYDLILDAIYVDFDKMPQPLYKEALKKANDFLDGGEAGDRTDSNKNSIRLMDWEQDEQLIFSAVNKAAGMEVRSLKYMHWWTFLGYFQAVGECLFTSIVNIRSKKAKGKKLDKGELAYYRENKGMIDLKKKYSQEEQEEYDRLNKLLD